MTNKTVLSALVAVPLGAFAAQFGDVKPIDVGCDLQLLWDDRVVDTAKTTATILQHSPRYVGPVHTIDHPWEGDCFDYANIVREPWGLRLYYKGCTSICCGRRSPGKFAQKRLYSPWCFIESRDGGLSWTTPDLGLVEMCGSKHNNVFLDKSLDNFYVFKDPNPDCPPAERYKALSGESDYNERGEAIPQTAALWCYTSSDGIHFPTNPAYRVSRGGAYDTLNICSWDARKKEYVLYVRDYHACRTGKDRNGEKHIRGIRVLRSKDFRTWTTPKPIAFSGDAEDYPLYTNGIKPYDRNPSVYVGFPGRTVERQAWTPTFDRLCGAEMRKLRMCGGRTPREGLTLWDTVFMFSRDGDVFTRFDEAMFRPGPEHPDRNWVYGDTMTTVGLVETPGTYGTDPELSIFLIEGVKLGVPGTMNRYVIRLDGFVSRNAPYKGATVVTKPIVFSGKELQLNFSTSARGFIYVTVRNAEGNTLESHEIFGDKVDRIVDFKNGNLAAFVGKPVVLEFRMSDADLYSFRFADEKVEATDRCESGSEAKSGPANGDTLTLRAGETGKMSITKDVSVGKLAVDIGIVDKKVNGGILDVDGPGCVTVGAGGVSDVTKNGRYCTIYAPLRFAADQAWDCSGREQLYFYGPLMDADPAHPVQIVKKGPQALYLGEKAAGSPLAASIRVENGSLCFIGKDCLGPKGTITLDGRGYLWYGGGANCRAVTIGKDCTVPYPLNAEIWGSVSEQSGHVTCERQSQAFRIANGKTLILSGGVSFPTGGELRLDFGDDATLVLSGKPWTGAKTTVRAVGKGVIEFKADRIFDGTVDLVLPTGFVCRLNGTSQRLGKLTVGKGARVVGPGRIETASGDFDLPEGGEIGGALPKVLPRPDWQKPIDVADKLQLLWDDHLVDIAQTTAEAVQHTPRFAETAHVFDRPWEGDCCFYEVIVKEKDRLRLYYKAVGSGLCDIYSKGKFKLHGGSKLAFIESRDGGLSWTTPDLGKIEVSGSTHNNVFHEEDRDNFFVMRDTNPACPEAERYKALSMWGEFNKNGTPDLTHGKPGLWCYVSSNGVDFTRSHLMSDKGAFDSINTAWWDAGRGEYHAFVRGYHGVKAERNNDLSVRDIRHMVSKDFRTWTTPEMLDFGEGAEDYPLYTNVIQPYYRDPSVYVGFPSRYVERKKWTDSYDKLCAPDRRKWRTYGGTHPRGGLTLWDTIFCFSRDAQRFTRFDEAMFRPGPEHPDQNWAYGDTMVTVGLLETKARFGTDPEISMFLIEGAHLGVATKLNRYVIRLDGFVSRHAPYAERRLVTKPIVFKGSELRLNFSTSARGRIFLKVRDEKGGELVASEIFGDKVDRLVGWDNGKLADFAGKPVVMEFRLSDADLYSFRFH